MTQPVPRPTPRRPPTPPAEGERRAVAGYSAQYTVAGVLIVDALDADLEAIRLADPTAGRVDDLQVLTPGRLDGYQVKWSRTPASTSWGRLLDADDQSPGLLAQLADGWQRLRSQNPDRRVVVHLITNDYPSVADPGSGSLERFAREVWPRRADGRPDAASNWGQAWDNCIAATGLNPAEFDQFVASCELEFGFALERSPFASDSQGLAVGATDIATLLWQTVASPARIVELTRDELLERLGWAHVYRQRHRHEFPVDARVYRAPRDARARLDAMLGSGIHGYAAVVGAPGTGKSSLLTDALRVRPEQVIRYYAFIPGDTAGAARGEAVSLLNDLVVDLRRLGFRSRRLPRDDRQWLREELRHQLSQLGQHFEETGRRTVLLIDGLDHTARQPVPERPLLAELPEVNEIPPGVLVLLGSQTTDLEAMPATVRQQVSETDRRIELGQLDAARVQEVIDAWNLEPPLEDRQTERIKHLVAGHPLSLTYVLRYVDGITAIDERDRRLASYPPYAGDLAGHYLAYWTRLSEDRDVADALALLARVRGPIDVPSLVAHLNAPGLATRIAERVGHFFRRPTAHRWTFFHDSFRQFIVDRTHLDDEACHQRLAAWREGDPASPELLYHRLMAGNEEGALSLATYDYFREQYTGRRPPEAIVRDVRLLAAVAVRRRRIGDLVRLLLVDSELEQRGYIIEREPLVRVLARLGDTASVIEYARQPARVGSQEEVDREAALALARAGYDDAAREIFDSMGFPSDRSDPADGHRLPPGLQEWGRTAAYLVPIERLEEMVAEVGRGDPDRAALVAAFAAAAANELIDRGDIEGSLRLTRRLNADLDLERAVRAQVLVQAARHHRLNGQTQAAREVLGEAMSDVWPAGVPTDVGYVLALELVAAGDPNAAEVASGLQPPGEVELRLGNQGLGPYHPWISWIALRFALGETPALEDVVQHLGARVDERIGRVVLLLGRLAGTAVTQSLSVWTFQELALAILRAFLPRPDRPSHESYELSGIRREAHEALVTLTARHGTPHLDMLLDVFEEEWRRPTLFWSEELRRAILVSFVEQGPYQARLRSWVERLEEAEPPPDANSRFLTWVERADARLVFGDPDVASEFVDRALRTSFSVGYRKDYQLEWWLAWLDRVNRLEPDDAAARIGVIAAALPDLDETTEGRATELAARNIVQIALRSEPSWAMELVEWLSARGALTFAGGAATILAAALDAGAAVDSVARYASAWVIPFEREASSELARTTAQGLAAAGTSQAASFLADRLVPYGRRATRRVWAAELLEGTTPDGMLPVEFLEAMIPPAESVDEGSPITRPAEDAEPRTFDELVESLAAERFPSSRAIRRRMAPFLGDATDEQLRSLRERLPAGPSVALTVSGDTLFARGHHRAAAALAEASLERRNPHGWDRNWDDGSVLDTLDLLRQIDEARARDLALETLALDIGSGAIDGSALMRSLEGVLPHITASNVDREVWAALGPYLEGLLELSRERPAPTFQGLAHRTPDQVLAGLAGQWLDHPVALLAQLTRESLAEEVATGAPAAIAIMSELLIIDPIQTTLAITVLEIVRESSPERIAPFRETLEDLRRSPSLDVRLGALRLLGTDSNGLAPARPATDVPATYRIAVPPSASRRLIRPRLLPEDGRPLVATNEAADITGGFEGEVVLLSRLAGLSRATIALRVVELMRAIGFGQTLDDGHESALMANLDDIGLRLPYVRPRAYGVRMALGRVAAELLDHGYIAADDATALEERFRWTDPILDTFPLGKRPPWLMEPVRPRDSRVSLDDWVSDLRIEERPLPTTTQGVVIAEYSVIRRLEWERPTEERRRTLVPAASAGAIAAGQENLFTETMISLSAYPSRGDPDGSLTLLNYGGVRFMTTKERWIAINPAVAASLDWSPDPQRAGGWHGADGERRVSTVIWAEGYVGWPSPDFDEEPGFGSYLVAAPVALEELADLAGDTLAFETAERTALVEKRDISATARQFWNWRRFA
jgi:hypothetical protein